MQRSRILLFLLSSFTSAIASSVAAQQIPYERLLVPLGASFALPGAFGSRWSTSLTAFNDADAPVDVTHVPGSLCTTCRLIQPREFFSPLFAVPNPNTGVFAYVGSAGAGRVRFTLRVQDVSRQALTWGTTIPVVRERDAFTGRLHLLDVPVDSRFRAALRIYDFDAPPASPSDDRAVRMRVYEIHGTAPLVDVVLPLTPHDVRGADRLPLIPSTAMLGDLATDFPQLASVVDPSVPPETWGPRVRIELEPVKTGLRFWAFVSVTNNETQHVTAIAPAQ